MIEAGDDMLITAALALGVGLVLALVMVSGRLPSRVRRALERTLHGLFAAGAIGLAAWAAWTGYGAGDWLLALILGGGAAAVLVLALLRRRVRAA